jgi:hypothetical protein
MLLLARSGLAGVFLAAVFVVALAPGAAFAQGTPAQGTPIAWDQQRVSEIAAQLAESAGLLYREFVKKQTGSQVGSGQANAYMRLKDDLRVARNEAKHLARGLAGGKSRAETEPAYRRLMTLVRDARESGRKMFLEQPILDEVGRANALLDQLAPYYTDAPEAPAASGADDEHAS